MADILRVLAIIAGVAAALGLIGVALIYRRLKRLNIPEQATFRETLQRVPFSVVLVLDLLDLGFDFLAAPLVWVLLGRFNLGALRRVSVIEALIPGTQFIPTLTASWLAVRWFDPAMRSFDAPDSENRRPGDREVL
jgi:hypothetical protein